MPLLAREVLGLPGGDNSSDTVISGVHFNKTILDSWNYTLYSNGSLSNGSWCILAFEPWTPASILPNGTWIREASCYRPIYGIGQRGGIAIGFAALFAIGLGLTLVTLRKHGRLYLPAEKRFYPIGRRWQWYWALFASTAAIISLFTSIDVDRYFLPELPVILTSFFWYLMQMGAMAIVWEAARHWGSWMERQVVDPDPFSLSQDDRRSKFEFWLPLVFYFFLWLHFFVIIPRSWTNIQHQRYPEQIILDAIPAATDSRFKAGPFLLVVCWVLIIVSLRHSIKHYFSRNRGTINRILGLFRFTPPRFYVLLPLALIIPAFQALIAWEFAYSPMNIKGMTAAIFAGGYSPTLLIIFAQVVWGFMTPNEDLELKRQRRTRGEDIDREMNVTHKPGWWRRVREAGEGGVVNPNENMRDRIARNVREVEGGRPTAQRVEERRTNDGPSQVDETVEIGPVSTGPPVSEQATELLAVAPGDFAAARATAARYEGLGDRTRNQRVMQHAASLLFPNQAEAAAAAARRHEEPMMEGPPPYAEQERPSAQQGQGSARELGTVSTGSSTTSPPQQIRSMLDV